MTRNCGSPVHASVSVPVCALPYFFSKRVKNGGFLVDVEKNL